MAMNVAAMNNMAMKSSMVGYVNNPKIAEVKKEEEHTTTIQELEEQDTGNNAGKAGQDTRGNEQAAQARNQQAAHQAQQRRISQPETQTQSTTTETSEGSGSEQTGQAQGQPEAGGRGPRVLLDNTARINWEFQTNRNSASAEGQAQNSSPEVQKKQFLSRLRNMVNMEYQQYVKSDTALYSRRNLREIMTALQGANDDPNLKRLEDQDRQSRETEAPPGELEGYNKFNQMRAANSLRILHEHQQEQPQDQLSLVA